MFAITLLLIGHLSTSPADMFRSQLASKYPCVYLCDGIQTLLNTKPGFRERAWKRSVKFSGSLFGLGKQNLGNIRQIGEDCGFFEEVSPLTEDTPLQCPELCSDP